MGRRQLRPLGLERNTGDEEEIDGDDGRRKKIGLKYSEIELINSKGFP